jgi:hypothetical protein
MAFVPFPIGLLLTVQLAHTVSPIVGAWSHREYRTKIMLRQPRKFVLVPALLMVGGLLVAWATVYLFPGFAPTGAPMLADVVLFVVNPNLQGLTIPVIVLGFVYAVWNIYHVGAQNFGFFALYSCRRYSGWGRQLLRGGMVTVAAVLVLVPFVLVKFFGLSPTEFYRLVLFTAGLLFGSHWLGAIGLAAHVHGRSRGCSPLWFVGAVLILGFGLSAGIHYLWVASVAGAVLAASLRAMFGIWHFLQDRWNYRLSDPQVCATIGRDLVTH